MQLRKTKSGQAASKMKPPKYNKELSFLVPYLQDDENRSTNIHSYDPSLDHTIEQTSLNSPSSSVLSPYPSSQCESFDYQDVSTQSTRRARSRNSDDTSTASVLKEYLERRERANNTRVTQSSFSYSDEKDPLIGFFMNMARTVKGFPIDEQIKLKNEIFSLVNSAELRIAMQLTARETEQTSAILSQPQIKEPRSFMLSHPEVIKTNANQHQVIQSNVKATTSTHQTIQEDDNCTAMLSQPPVPINNMNSLTPSNEIQVLQSETFPENTYTLTLTQSDLANFVVFNNKPNN